MMGFGMLATQHKSEHGFMSVEVLQASTSGLPEDVLFRFAAPLSDSKVKVYYWNATHETYEPLRLLPGEERSVPPPIDVSKVARKLLGDRLMNALEPFHWIERAQASPPDGRSPE